jgi:hypothetical protein
MMKLAIQSHNYPNVEFKYVLFLKYGNILFDQTVRWMRFDIGRT